MKALIQRVEHAHVSVSDEVVASIGPGLLVFLGIEKEDQETTADKMLQKLISYRVFADEEGKMNLSLLDCKGDLLFVSQFTLAADTKKGKRPSFSSCAPPDQGEAIYKYILEAAAERKLPVQSGVFGADMKVHLVNDGPVTFNLSVN